MISKIDIKEEIQEKYADVFQDLGKLDGKLHLEVKENVRPVQLPPRKIPIALKSKLKGELSRLESMGVIKPVDTPTEWVSALVVAPKRDGNIRLCIDPKPLNEALMRNHYPTPTIEDILPELHQARVFSIVDAKDGFWHIELDDESSYLTTFSTPWGKYRWLRMPFGISVAPEEFQRRMDDALGGLEGIKPIHDDILIYGCGETDTEAEEDHNRKLRALMDRCAKRNIKLNPNKMKLKLTSVTYLGYVISKEGLSVDPHKLEAILEMPTPQDRAAVQRLLGMTNFVQRFAPQLSEVTKPLRDLLKADTHFLRDNDVHGTAFAKVKTILSQAPVLKFFDPGKQLTLQCDASASGLGACLMQENHPIAYASRSLTSAEQNYAQIEKETLAAVFGMEHFENYTYGRHVTIQSDHKPLEIIVRKNLHNAPKRLQRMLLRLQKFDYSVEYKKGTEMYFADTLSRAYLKTETEKIENNLHDIHSVNHRSYLAISDDGYNQIKQATENDAILQSLKRTILQGWPDSSKELPPDLQVYFPFREELVVQNGVIYKGERVVVPKAITPSVLQRIHNSHIGIRGCIHRAQDSLYWPNMSRDIELYVSQCAACNTYTNDQQREPMISHEIPSRPWQIIGCDLFECENHDYLILSDYYSDYFEVERIHGKTANVIIRKMKAQFARHGIPDKVVSDNGPPFGSKDSAEFGKAYEFEHVTSSPRYPQSNGKAEISVKIAKQLIHKCAIDNKDPYLALLDFRNTPTQGIGYSPAQRIFGRRTKTLLPVAEHLLKPHHADRINEKLHERKERQTQYYNRGVKELNPLTGGDVVRIRPTENEKAWKKALVEDQVDVRSYNVRTEDGRIFRRNRRHLRFSREPFYQDPATEAFKPADTRQQPHVHTEPNQPQNSEPVISEVPQQPEQPVLSPVPVQSPQPAVQSPKSEVKTRSGRVIKKPQRFSD